MTFIHTTHVGSLPFASFDQGLAVGDAAHLKEDAAAVVRRQRDLGIDIVNEGEYTKGGDWLRYMQNRFGGFADIAATGEKPLIEQGRDREAFSDFYRYASERGTLFFAPGEQMQKIAHHHRRLFAHRGGGLGVGGRGGVAQAEHVLVLHVL